MQILHGDGFQKILEHAQLDGFLGIFELVVAAEDDDLGRGHAVSDDLAELQTIHERHPDIGDQDVGSDRLQERQGHLAVGGFTAELKAVGLPVHIVADTLTGHDLVLDEEDFVQHGGSSSSLVGGSEKAASLD